MPTSIAIVKIGDNIIATTLKNRTYAVTSFIVKLDNVNIVIRIANRTVNQQCLSIRTPSHAFNVAHRLQGRKILDPDAMI